MKALMTQVLATLTQVLEVQVTQSVITQVLEVQVAQAVIAQVLAVQVTLAQVLAVLTQVLVTNINSSINIFILGEK